MPSVKEIYHKIDDVRIEADSINLNVDGLEALASTQQADIALIKSDVDDIRADLANGVSVTGTFWQTTQPVSGSVTGLSDKGSVSAASTQSITTGGTHQQVFASNSSRKFLLVQNLSDTDMYLGLGFNPSNTTPAGLLLSKGGGGVVFESNYIPTSEIRIVCATTGKVFVALEG